VFPTSLKASITAAQPAAVALINAGREGGRQDLIGGREGRLRPGPHHRGRQDHRQQAGRPSPAPRQLHPSNYLCDVLSFLLANHMHFKNDVLFY
jgi:hypothetical protein